MDRSLSYKKGDDVAPTKGFRLTDLELVEIGARMKIARKQLKLTQEGLATLAGATSNRGVQDNEAGKSMPGGQMIRALARAKVNANWLLTGEGPMMLTGSGENLGEGAQIPQPPLSSINFPALTAILEGVLHVQGGKATPARIAELTIDFYNRAISEQLITPTEVGAGTPGSRDQVS